jgi:serine/threonine-protein kinase
VSRAILFRKEGRFEDALREEQRAMAAKQSLLGAEHLDIALSGSNMSIHLHDLGRDAEAEPILRKTIDIITRIDGPDNARMALVLLNYAEVLTELRRFDEAETALRRALAIWKERGASPWFEGYALLDLGRLKLTAGAPREARGYLERALPILKAHQAPLAAEAEFALAQVLWSAPVGRPRAIELARRAQKQFVGEPASRRKLAAVDAWLRERGQT